MVTISQIKQLREETGISVTECKKALEKTNGDLEKAKEVLRKWGQDLAGKKSSREAKEGIIETYIHSNKKIGVLVEMHCETDFVARSEDFKTLAHDLCLHITASNPFYLKEEDILEEEIRREREIYKEQFSGTGKPEKIVEKMIEGKLKKYKEGICLLTQPFVKSPDKTVQDVLNEYIAKLGENITVKKFVRFEI